MQPGLISSAHLHLEKNNKLKFNVAIMRVYGECEEKGGRGKGGLDEGALRGEWADLEPAHYRNDLMRKYNPSLQILHVSLHNTGYWSRDKSSPVCAFHHQERQKSGLSNCQVKDNKTVLSIKTYCIWLLR